ncbi:MAG: quinolinate synthase [Euryarchaeota archaeon]|nr:quinolinate synthase [Euryarchaeota archaeon]
MLNLPVIQTNPMAHFANMPDEDIAERIEQIREKMGDDLLILGHHYQGDAIIQHADMTGDSFLLAQLARSSNATHVVFCGVHFMAESADILTSDEQMVFLPNMRAGCSMADMATLTDVEAAWSQLSEHRVIPVTYMNSSAEIKAFVGRHGGTVCTSSNAHTAMKWAFEEVGDEGKVLFIPDQHLGRNTALEMGMTHDSMMVWNPATPPEPKEIEGKTLLLWHGYCSVHQRFRVDQIERFREEHQKGKVVVHPECSNAVVEMADAVGSTEFIRSWVADQKPGDVIGVGTEVHLVQRLNELHSDRTVLCLDDSVCPCSTMYMIQPPYLLGLLESLLEGKLFNQVTVEQETTDYARRALEQMLELR